MLDDSAIVKQKKRIVHGAVPKITIIAEKVQNKKITTVGGQGNTLQLFLVDYDEMATYLAKKCAASASVCKEVVG